MGAQLVYIISFLDSRDYKCTSMNWRGADTDYDSQVSWAYVIFNES